MQAGERAKRVRKTSKMELRYKEKINSCSLANALKGERISEDFAKQLAKLLGCKVNTICTIEKRKQKVAFESNHKIKRTLRVILASAKKQRIITDNYASSDFINFPQHRFLLSLAQQHLSVLYS